MNPVLQQWFLNLAIDFAIHFRHLPGYLDSDDETSPGALNVRPLRGFTLADGVRCIAELSDRGLVRIIHPSEADERRTVSGAETVAMPTATARRELLFELTKAGGDAWEQVAQPRWFDMSDGYADVRLEDGEIIGWDWTLFSQNRHLLMAELGWRDFINEEVTDLDTITWTFHDEYQVRYWKLLPNVHEVKFLSSSVADPPRKWRDIQPDWFSNWFSATCSWYRRPWEMEGWPPTPER